MSLFWPAVIFILVFAILFKMFKSLALSLLLFLVLEIILIIIKPEILTLLAEIAVRARGLLGA